jgi:cysteinyl-tRNA synthetase
MGIRIFNTLTHKKEDFVPLQPGKVSMYVCGPTVYSKAHIGHAMSSLVYDVIHRYFEYRGFKVTHVMNYTDVDDKIIQRANQMGMDPLKLAEIHIAEYQKHLKDLNVVPPSITPRASQEMQTIIDMISKLIEKGFAYPAGGDVYFRVQKDPSYGKLSGRKKADMQIGEKNEAGVLKEDPMDFALWKSAKPGEPWWDSPWGKGRPGWHIECSAMNLTHLGEQIDLHGGGNDLIFPHHENEIAQTESLTGKPFAQFWVHNGMLQYTGEKMSKSLGNLVTIEDYLAAHSADSLRYLVLNSGYRNPLSFNEEIIGQADSGLDRLKSGLRPAMPDAKGIDDSKVKSLETQAAQTKETFIQLMDDDFNSAGALGAIFELIRAVNQTRADGATDAQLEKPQAQLKELIGVLGLRLDAPKGGNSDAVPFIELLVKLRQDLRASKQWSLADQLRDQLLELGVIIEDSKAGVSWRWKE